MINRLAGLKRESDSSSGSAGSGGGGYGSVRRRRGLYYGWVVVAISLVVGLVLSGMRFTFGVFFKPLESEFQLSRATTSSIMSLNLLVGFLVCIGVGWALDRYGPKLVVILMSLFAGVSFILISQAQHLWQLYLCYGLLLSIGVSAVFVVFAANSAKWFARRRGLALAVVTAAISIGTAITAPLAAYLITAYSWRTSFLILGCAGLIIMLPLSFFFKRPPAQVPEEEADTRSYSASTDGESSSVERKKSSMSEMARTWGFWSNILIWFGGGFCMFTVYTHLVPHVQDLKYTPEQAASVLSVLTFAGLFGRLVMGWLVDTIGSKLVTVISHLGAGLTIVWLIWVDNLWGLYLIGAIYGFFWGGVGAATAAFVADIFGLHRLGLIMGMFDGTLSLGATFGPIFAGYIFDVRGSYSLVFLIMMLILVFLTVVILTVKVPRVRAPS